MAAGCEDSTIKVKKLSDKDDFIELKAHNGPILFLDLNPHGKHLASSAGDGTIRIWNLDTKEVLKTIENLPQASEFSAAKVLNSPVFDKTGKYLAYPSGKSISVIKTSDWEVKFKLENPSLESTYTVCSFSHCGLYIAAGTSKGQVSIWELSSKEVVKGEYNGEEEHPITAIEWNPKNKDEVAFTDSDGQLSTANIKDGQENANGDDEKVEVEDPDDIYGGIDFRDDDEDADNENCVALDKLKNETLKNDISDDDMESVKSVRSRLSYTPARKFNLQPPFQPASTPEHLEHRFMVWNHVGQVVSHTSEDENSIIAEFNDASVHSSFHIINSLNHQLASLSTTCLALATKQTPCKLVCIALQSAGGREWSVTMPDCEGIIGVAAGDAFVAVATDSNFLRFFTTMGTQREVISVPGKIVCISAYGNKIIAAYHTSTSSNKYSLMIITVLGLVMSNRTVELPTSSDAKLNWIGFSDTSSIITFETTGRVMSYNIKHNLWMQIGDLTEHLIGASDNFFMVGVSEKSQKIRASLCRGTSYPLTNPRPILREFDYSIPLCHMETEKSKLEEALVRSTNFEMDASEKSVVENALKLFSMAMNVELESRAFEIVELIAEKKLIELAAKYSSQKGRMHLTNKITKLLHEHEEKEAEKFNFSNALENNEKAFTEMYDKTPIGKNDNLLQSTPIIVPRPMMSQKKANPFAKKPNDKSTASLAALNHLTKKSIVYNDSVTNSDDENVPLNNSSLINNKSISKDTPRPGNFSQWFIANKLNIRADNPDVNDGELMKIGKQLYKEMTQGDMTPAAATMPLNKRKLEMNDEGGVSKLAKFGYTE